MLTLIRARLDARVADAKARAADYAARELGLVTRSELRVACGHTRSAVAAVATIDREERERILERVAELEAGRFAKLVIPTTAERSSSHA